MRRSRWASPTRRPSSRSARSSSRARRPSSCRARRCALHTWEDDMEWIRHALHLLTSVEGLTEVVRWGGLPILAAIVFAETGLFFGFFFPGDSLLVTAGFLAATTDVL